MDVNIGRFIKELTRINQIGYRSDHGITRLAFSQKDMDLRKEIKSMCMELELIVMEDGAGNIWARKKGLEDSLPAVLVGSHVDSVHDGGGYDGVLGVMAGLEVIRMIKENNIQNISPIEVVIFSVEESSRFNISTVGSKLITGKIKGKNLKNYSDEDGISLYDEMVNRGYDPDNMESAKKKLKKAKAFFELHIEQGPILENKGMNIGVVEGIAAPLRLKIDVIGKSAHSGACPMNMRSDALTAASEIILAVEKAGNEESINKTVATVGKCNVINGAMNVVPGDVELYVDIRGIKKESVVKCYGKIQLAIDQICKKRELKYNIDILCDEDPVALDKDLNYLVKQSCLDLGLTYEIMQSGAGHDTMNIADVVKSTLIFIPCIDGVSHNKNEEVSASDIKNGIQLLYEIVTLLTC